MSTGDAEALLAKLQRDDMRHLWVSYSDYNGRSQGKSIPKSRFASTAERGITFARANLGHNVTDHGAPDTIFTADSGDFFAVPDPTAYYPYPLMADTARAVCWMRQEGGDAWEGCPRTRLKLQVDAYADRGLSVQAAYEPEGYLFRQGEDGTLHPAIEKGMFTVNALNSQAAFFHRVSDTLEEMGVALEQVAPEWAPGQFEVNLKYGEAIRAADNLLILKDTVRALAREAGLVATFMPKVWEDSGGSGNHIHLSLWDREGKSLSEGTDHPSGLGEVSQWFLAGILAHARALVGVGAPTPNSYKRLQAGSWAPAHAAYSISNRSSLVRIPGKARQRVEFRSGDNLSNPYLFLAALMAAGLDGIDRRLPLGAPAEGDLGHMAGEELERQGIAELPRTAAEALDAVEADAVVMAAFGPIIGPEWLRVKRSEVALYNTVVSNWERETYLLA